MLCLYVALGNLILIQEFQRGLLHFSAEKVRRIPDFGTKILAMTLTFPYFAHGVVRFLHAFHREQFVAASVDEIHGFRTCDAGYVREIQIVANEGQRHGVNAAAGVAMIFAAHTSPTSNACSSLTLSGMRLRP